MSAWHLLSCEGLSVKNFYDEFLLLRRQDDAYAMPLPRLGQCLLKQRLPFVDEVIATEIEICLRLNSHFKEFSYPSVMTQLVRALGQVQVAEPQTDWRLPVCFDSANDRSTMDDWIEVERATGIAGDEIIERLLQAELRLAMFGFLPGFAYLSGLPEELHVPRKSNPTTRTRRNAVALGSKYLGIYSLPSPAGWHVVGELGVNMLRHDILPPIAISPGDRVRLERISASRLTQLKASSISLSDYNYRVA